MIGGGIALIVILTFLSLLFGDVPNVLLFGIAMTVFTFGVMLGGAFSASRYKLAFSRAVIVAIVGAVMIGICGCLLEAIYELRFFQKKTVLPANQSSISLTDYIFCLDDSGSMMDNDPNALRDSAIEELLDQLETTNQVGLLRFNSWIKTGETVYAAMLDDTQKELLRTHLKDHEYGGNTDFSRPLREALIQYKQIDEKGRIPVVVLVTDGECSLNTDKWVRKYQDAGVTICGIYMGEGTQIPTVLQALADGTNGIALKVDQAAELKKAFEDMVSQTSSATFGVANDPSYRRFLLGPRRGADRINPIAFIERILFFAMLGTALGFFLYREMDSDTALQHQIVLSGAEGLICGVVLEIGYLIGLGDVSRIAVMLMSIVLAQYVALSLEGGGRGPRPGTRPRPGGINPGGELIGRDNQGSGRSGSIRRG